MAIDELARQLLEYIINCECPLLLRHLGIKEDLQQEIAQFAAQFIPVAFVDRLENFIGFFQRVRFDGVEGLLAIPRAASGGAQPGHNRDSTLKTSTRGRRHWPTI